MSNSKKQSFEPGAIELDAFRFLSGEMNADEQSRFESLLVEQPDAAAVLSQVIQMEAALSHLPLPHLAQPALTIAHDSEHSTRVASERSWLSVVAAIAACLVVSVLLVRNSDESNEAQPVVSVGEPQVIENWLDVAELLPAEPLFVEEEPIELAMLTVEDVPMEEPDEIVPGWMYAVFQADDGGSAE
ncbi:MAG: hypothetical protein AB8G99_23375 [Planctomycetaceae bacterium]